MPKWGEMDPKTGLIFWSNSHNWLTPTQFEGYMATRKRAADRFKINHPNYSNEQEQKHHEKNVVARRKYYKENTDTIKQRSKDWGVKNPDRKKQISRKSYTKRLKTNPSFRARVYVGNRVANALRRKGFEKRAATIPLIGCSPEYLKSYIEAKFQPGMSWDNWSLDGWHIDHKIPLSSGKTQAEMEALCHYTNLQPLWAKENMKKGSKII